MRRLIKFSLVLASMLAVTVTCDKSSNPMRSIEPAQSAKVTPLSQPTQPTQSTQSTPLSQPTQSTPLSPSTPSTQPTPSTQSEHPASELQLTQQTTGDTARKATSELQSDPATEDTGVRSGYSDPGAPGSVRLSKGENATAVFDPDSALQPKHHGSNHAPVMNQPISNINRTLLLPHGPAALVEFPGEPGSDADGDELTYRFHFSLFGMTGIQTPEEALLRITRPERNHFEILPDGDVTPSEFTAVWGDLANISGVETAITANDGTAESGFRQYNLDLAYDASAQYSAPAVYVGDQRWEYPEPIDWYEGTPAPIGGAYPAWTAVTSGLRVWRLDRLPGTIRCEIVTFSGFYDIEEGGEDNRLFTVASEARANSGTVRPNFRSSPDFETPGDEDGDNIYHLRAVNKHDIHGIEGEGNPTGCNGSILDFAIRVRDVGVPAPPRIVHASFMETDVTTIEVSWTDPGGFIENGSLAAFPGGFEVNDYDFRYRPLEGTSWIEETDGLLTDTSVMIDGLTGSAYEVQVRAGNREGVGAWSPAVQVTRLAHNTMNPSIVGVRISSTPEHEATYDRGETIEIEVEFSEPVEVIAAISPYIWLRTDHPRNKIARYTHGTGTDKLYFQYTVRLHDFDRDGVGVESGEIEAPDGSITTVSGSLPANLYQAGLPDDPNHKIDGCL